jgi:antitoxin (DNA-binding transcriptional repressor) of toxin-antitoxin stability system
MRKQRRIMAATELRVHLGEVLRALEREDIVIAKGGVPVALLVRYEPESAGYEPGAAAAEEEYERALSRRAEPGGAERMDAAMAAGWAGIDAEELAANVYRWREEGVSARRLSLDDDPAEVDDDGSEVPARQRHLYQIDPQTRRIAEPDGPGYSS